jgi:iron complex outermembrane receptor protein
MFDHFKKIHIIIFSYSILSLTANAQTNKDTTHQDSIPHRNTEQLQTVEITGRKEQGYKNTNSFIGTKTATPLKDVPQSISYVTKELMQDQAAVRMGM